MPLNTSSQMSIDQFNQRLRSNPQYQAYLRAQGVNLSGPIRLTDQQRRNAEAWVRRTYGDIGNLQIDPAGNLNQDEGFSRHKQWMIPAAIGAGTLGLGAFGVGPAAGLFGSGGGASGALGGGLNATLDSLAASHAAGGASAAAGLGSLNPVLDRLSGGASRAAGGLGGRLLDNLLSPEGLVTAGSIAASLAARGDGTSDATRASEEQARRMQAITEARMRRVDPLHEAITQLAFGRLPVSSRQGLSLPRVPLPE